MLRAFGHGSSGEVRSQKALRGRFCPYLPDQKIADGPLRALWGRLGSDCPKRYGDRRP
ncbi:MAG: hypothetical protein MJY70_07655 [Bacteroidales bacterium]|nr:hypothetical protein [Bacteroidales bacterium]